MHCIIVSDLCSFVIIQTTCYNFLKGMKGDLNNTDPVEWDENENSRENEISNAGIFSSTKNIEAQDIDSIEVPTEKDPLKHAYQRKPRNKTFIVWKHFTKVEIKCVKKHQCNWCKMSFTISKSSCTSTMGRHLKTCLSYIGANKRKKQKVLSLEGTEVYGVGSVILLMMKGRLEKFVLI
jgi:hypothetical protein